MSLPNSYTTHCSDFLIQSFQYTVQQIYCLLYDSYYVNKVPEKCSLTFHQFAINPNGS